MHRKTFDEIKKVIKDHLPEASAWVLKDVMEEYEQMKLELVKKDKLIEECRELNWEHINKIVALKKKIGLYIDIETREEDVKRWESDLNKRSLEMEKDKLLYELSAEKDKTNTVTDLFKVVFKNPVMQNTVIGQDWGITDWQWFYQIKTIDKTTTEEVNPEFI